MIRSKVLKLPEWPVQSSVKTTFVDSIGRMLAFLDDRRGTAELMGHSSFAFRMKISNQTTFADGIYMFDWKRTLLSFMEELGYKITILCGQLADSPIPLLGAVERFPIVLSIEEAVLPFIRKYIDLGKPVLYFDTLAVKPFVHEWSIIYGYDDEQRIVYLTDQMLPDGKTLSYDDVTDNPVRFAAGIDEVLAKGIDVLAQRVSKLQKQAERTIRFAVDYARQGCDYRPMTSYLQYTSGLAAYDRWIGHLSNTYTVPNRYGMGQLCMVYAEAKRYASLYLRRVPFEGEAMRMVLLASEAYEQTAEALEMLSATVPFIRSSEMFSPQLLETCITYLNRAKEFETAAIGYLEKALAFNMEEKGRE